MLETVFADAQAKCQVTSAFFKLDFGRHTMRRIGVVGILFCLFVYFVIPWLQPLAPLANRLAKYSTGTFIIVFFLYALSFFLEARSKLPFGLLFTLVMVGMTLLSRWSSGFSDNGIIGGLLPYKDGRNYYAGLQMLLNGMLIPKTSLQAAWRPLFPGFLSVFAFLSGNRLQWMLILVYGGTAISLYLAVRQVVLSYGTVPGALLATFLLFYLQPFVGFTMSESAGFLFGCIAFVLLWNAAQRAKKGDLLIGMVVLTLALSIRAGPFFMLPMLILWAGWAFREKVYSIKTAVLTALSSLVGFIVMNVIYPRLVVEAGGIPFGNFAYTLFGQVRGGTGWHYAIEVMKTTDPEPILQEALRFFLQHPLSFFIGAAKSYRDFLFTTDGLFGFIPHQDLIGKFLWIVGMLLFWIGFFKAMRLAMRLWKSDALFSFLLASLIGVFLSVPFLPPIDGGTRFYASSTVFILTLTTISLPFSRVHAPFSESTSLRAGTSTFALFSLSLVLITIVFPVLILRSTHPLSVPPLACPDNLEPFVIRIFPDSYIDLVQQGRCGLVPRVCLQEFVANCIELKVDDFYQKLVSIAQQYPTLRVTLALNLINGHTYYFFGSPEQLEMSTSGQLIAGCATYLRSRTQHIYLIHHNLRP